MGEIIIPYNCKIRLPLTIYKITHKRNRNHKIIFERDSTGNFHVLHIDGMGCVDASIMKKLYSLVPAHVWGKHNPSQAIDKKELQTKETWDDLEHYAIAVQAKQITLSKDLKENYSEFFLKQQGYHEEETYWMKSIVS